MKLIVAMSGASGAHLGLKFAGHLPNDMDVHFISTESSGVVLKREQNLTVHDDTDIGASVASGSFGCDAMIIVPCSMNTLAKIAAGIADNLTSRAASVMIKEQKKLILAPREMPFSPIVLENMLKLSRLGVVIAPPVLGYYSGQETLEEMEKFLIGKWMDLLGLSNTLYQRWEG